MSWELGDRSIVPASGLEAHQIVRQPIATHHHDIPLFHRHRERLSILHRSIPRVSSELKRKVELQSPRTAGYVPYEPSDQIVLDSPTRISPQGQTHTVLHLFGPEDDLTPAYDDQSAVPQVCYPELFTVKYRYQAGR